MPTKDYRFTNLIADASGAVTGRTTDTQVVTLSMDRIVVQSRSGCNGRLHGVSARLTGGVSFQFNGQLTDCTPLDVALGGLVLPAFTQATIEFTVYGYNPGEVVDLDGTLHASFAFESAARRVAEIVPENVGGLMSVGAAMVSAAGSLFNMTVQSLPIVGSKGIFATARNDFLSMVNAINRVATEIQKSNARRDEPKG